jgi:MFS family permease
MRIDVLLPLSLFLILSLSLLLSERIGRKVEAILGGKKLGAREIFFMVISMGIMVSLIVLMPNYAIQILFIAAYSYMLLMFTYLLLDKIFLAFIPPAIFTVAYLMVYMLVDDALTANVIMSVLAAVFAIMIITYLNSLFSWKMVVLFAILLTAMDIIQVFITAHMIEAATKMITLRLPVAIILPTFPSTGYAILGLGDIFLSGLLSAQTAHKYGRKTGFIIIASISIALFIFEALALNLEAGLKGFPATIIVLLGCLLGLGIHALRNRIRQKNYLEEK